MITNLRLKFGHSSGMPPESIATTPITVFVGPNNSGKTKLLGELWQYCQAGIISESFQMISDVSFLELNESQINEAIKHISLNPSPGEIVSPDRVIVGSKGSRNQFQISILENVLNIPNSNKSGYCQWFLRYCTLLLDGRSRINLVNHQQSGDLQMPPQSSLQLLFKDDDKRHEVRRIVKEAFGSYFVIDPTHGGLLRIRLSERPPQDITEEQGLHEKAIQFHGNAQLIDFAGDGVKAFIGIITELIAGDPKVLLIDEPEAFLHPSLAFKLGLEVSIAAKKSHKRVFASTHSSNFVMGCIQSGAPVNIVRLTYRAGTATARSLPSGEILSLMRNPLLRSTGVLAGLFYEFVVVTESDADRAFYQEINERLLRLRPDWGIPNCLFLHAQNKQTVKIVLEPLRKLGIPAAGIVDIDVIKDGGSVWTSLLDSAHVPVITRNSLAAARSAVLQAMDNTGRNMKRDGGVEILGGAEREAAENLLGQLAEYGIFVVPGGELESWLKFLDCSGHGPQWLVKIFEEMGDDPNDGSYIKPTETDVWKFVGSVKAWLFRSDRKGIPM